MSTGDGASEDERQALLEFAAGALLDGERRYTAVEVCERTGCDRDTADLLWRAMGFPDVPDDEVAFADRDVAALQAALDLEQSGLLDGPTVRGQARVMSQALATIAAAHLEIADPDERDIDRLSGFVVDILPHLDDLLVYLYRRHLLAAAEQSLLLGRDESELPSLSVGFADLVGFTRVANNLEEGELSALVEHFTEATADIVAEGSGRVVKMIGDEVMFTSPDPAMAALTAVRLVNEIGEHDGLPPLRAGVACGPVVLRHGDVFGAPVNFAHRLVDVARPGNVLADEAVAASVVDGDVVEAKRVHSIRKLRGFEKVRAFVLVLAQDHE